MAQLVFNGATLMCSFGAAPSTFAVLPKNKAEASGQSAANILDYAPMVNIMPFGMCSSLANPQVAAATTAALGVLTPQQCTPVTTAPWIIGSPTVLLNNSPGLNNTSTCMCTWGGVISVVSPGQFSAQIP